MEPVFAFLIKEQIRIDYMLSVCADYELFVEVSKSSNEAKRRNSVQGIYLTIATCKHIYIKLHKYNNLILLEIEVYVNGFIV